MSELLAVARKIVPLFITRAQLQYCGAGSALCSHVLRSLEVRTLGDILLLFNITYVPLPSAIRFQPMFDGNVCVVQLSPSLELMTIYGSEPNAKNKLFA